MEDKTEVKKTHQQIRYETAQVLAKEIQALPPEEYADFLEQALLQGERRGAMGAIEFLKHIIVNLKLRMTNGVANHVQQATVQLYDWVMNSGNYELYERPPKADGAPTASPRKYFGQPKG